ncbi:MAG TPA: hypothetical protein VMR28_00460 [Candidatus Saccharimonadales bacterium]|nr:hypothetical protein [Candidatus Saccharimonadales bacterium]
MEELKSDSTSRLSNQHQKYNYQPELSKALGSVNAGIVLSYLIHHNSNKTESASWSPQTVAVLKEATGLSLAQQQRAVKVLVRHNLVGVKRAGIPSSRNFRLNSSAIPALLESSRRKEVKLCA